MSDDGVVSAAARCLHKVFRSHSRQLARGLGPPLATKSRLRAPESSPPCPRLLRGGRRSIALVHSVQASRLSDLRAMHFAQPDVRAKANLVRLPTSVAIAVRPCMRGCLTRLV